MLALAATMAAIAPALASAATTTVTYDSGADTLNVQTEADDNNDLTIAQSRRHLHDQRGPAPTANDDPHRPQRIRAGCVDRPAPTSSCTHAGVGLIDVDAGPRRRHCSTRPSVTTAMSVTTDRHAMGTTATT